MFTEKPNTMNVSHILVKTEDEAKKVKKRLDAKEDFAKVARKYHRIQVLKIRVDY